MVESPSNSEDTCRRKQFQSYLKDTAACCLKLFYGALTGSHPQSVDLFCPTLQCIPLLMRYCLDIFHVPMSEILHMHDRAPLPGNIHTDVCGALFNSSRMHQVCSKQFLLASSQSWMQDASFLSSEYSTAHMKLHRRVCIHNRFSFEIGTHRQDLQVG